MAPELTASESTAPESIMPSQPESPESVRHAAFSCDQPWEKKRAVGLSARTLAYVGDSVNELAARLFLVTTGCDRAGRLHDSAVRLVNTSHQAHLFRLLFPTLPEAEQALLKSWRNAKMPYRGAGTSRGEYARATAFEAWVGFLFLTGQQQRLEDLFKLAHSTPPANPAPPPNADVQR